MLASKRPYTIVSCVAGHKSGGSCPELKLRTDNSPFFTRYLGNFRTAAGVVGRDGSSTTVGGRPSTALGPSASSTARSSGPSTAPRADRRQPLRPSPVDYPFAGRPSAAPQLDALCPHGAASRCPARAVDGRPRSRFAPTALNCPSGDRRLPVSTESGPLQDSCFQLPLWLGGKSIGLEVARSGVQTPGPQLFPCRPLTPNCR